MNLNELLKESLETYISSVSEDYWCAGWLSNIEYELFAFMTEDEALPTRLLSFYGADVKRTLQGFWDHLNGWVYWDEESSAPVFVDKETWLEMYQAYKDKRDLP